MRRGRAAVVTSMLALLLAGARSAPAEAQRANHNDVIIGSRAAAMGGAFTGVADDTSAVFHNPAGIAQILLGAFTDFSSVPDQGARQIDKLDMHGASLGVRHLGESSDLTVGLSGRYGTGTTFNANLVDRSTRFTGEGDATRWSLTVFVGGNASTAENGESGPDLPIP